MTNEYEYEYLNPAQPKLYRLNGEYLAGLANLLGVHECLTDKPHQFEDDKCTNCGLERTKKT